MLKKKHIHKNKTIALTNLLTGLSDLLPGVLFATGDNNFSAMLDADDDDAYLAYGLLFLVYF